MIGGDDLNMYIRRVVEDRCCPNELAFTYLIFPTILALARLSLHVW